MNTSKTTENTLNTFRFAMAKNILPLYKAFIIDLWGVVHDGLHSYPGVIDCLNYLISKQYPIIFLSNAPRPRHVAMKKLLELGVQVKPEMILTSGDAVRHQLVHADDANFRKLGKSIYHLGAHRNQDILAELEIELTLANSLTEADYVLLSAYLDEGEDLTQFDEFLKQAATLNIPLVCANPDKIVVNGNSKRYCAGVLAEKYEKMGGIVYYYGKPHRPILEFALKQLQEKGITDKKNVLIIGDTLETDIKSGHVIGIDSALVLTGNMEILLSEKYPLEKNNKVLSPSELSEFLNKLFKQQGITPTWVMPSLSF